MSAVVITGAASGIGRAVALAAARRSPDPLVLVDRDQHGLTALATEFAGAVPLLPLAGDLADPAFAGEVIAVGARASGGVKALVGNAGIVGNSPLAELSLAEFDHELAVNLRATWLLAKAGYPYLKAARGTLVATASIAASVPAPDLGIYGPSKAALAALVKQLAVEWAGNGIRCNSVSPGPTRTGITAAAYADPAALAVRERAIPLGHVGEAEDVAEVILFLIGDTSRFVTGTDIVVDGGFSFNLMRSAGAATHLTSASGEPA